MPVPRSRQSNKLLFYAKVIKIKMRKQILLDFSCQQNDVIN